MKYIPYPVNIDCLWVASDALNHIGVFITAGIGPVPLVALDSSRMNIINVESEILKSAVVSEFEILVSVPQPDTFAELAARGIYVYDWTDVEKIMVEAVNMYELVAEPSTPVTIDSLPREILELAEVARFDGIDFAKSKFVDARKQFRCIEFS